MEAAHHVISVRQPWASAIVEGVKDIENRNWPTQFRGTVFIHSSMKHYEDEFIGFCSLYEDRGIDEEAFLDRVIKRELPLGKIVGQVDIVDCVQESDSPWFVGQHGFVLKNPIAFKKPIPLKGKLGITRVNPLHKCDGNHSLNLPCKGFNCWHGSDNLLPGYYLYMDMKNQDRHSDATCDNA